MDNVSGPWGNVGVDDIVFSDRPRETPFVLTEQFDYGTMGLALLDPAKSDRAVTALPDSKVPAGVFPLPTHTDHAPATRPFGRQARRR